MNELNLEKRLDNNPKGFLQKVGETLRAGSLYFCISGLIPIAIGQGDTISGYFHSMFPGSALDYQSELFNEKGAYDKAIRIVGEFNHLQNPDNINVGDELYIPLSVALLVDHSKPSEPQSNIVRTPQYSQSTIPFEDSKDQIQK